MRKTGRLSKTRANDLKPERSFLEKLSPDQTRALVPENKPWPQSERWSALTTSTQLWSLFAGFDVHSSWGTRSELLTLQWHRAQRKTRPSLCAAAANLTLLYSLMKMKSYLYITIQNTIQYPDNTEYSRLNRNLHISRESKCDQYKVAWFGSDLWAGQKWTFLVRGINSTRCDNVRWSTVNIKLHLTHIHFTLTVAVETKLYCAEGIFCPRILNLVASLFSLLVLSKAVIIFFNNISFLSCTACSCNIKMFALVTPF